MYLACFVAFILFLVFVCLFVAIVGVVGFFLGRGEVNFIFFVTDFACFGFFLCAWFAFECCCFGF